MNYNFFLFIADKATDASTMKQMNMVLRFFDKEKGGIREEFVGFSEVKRTTGEELADAFLANLTQLGVVLNKMSGQGYDGAANMSGVRRGVQARISQIFLGLFILTARHIAEILLLFDGKKTRSCRLCAKHDGLHGPMHWLHLKHFLKL